MPRRYCAMAMPRHYATLSLPPLTPDYAYAISFDDATPLTPLCR